MKLLSDDGWLPHMHVEVDQEPGSETKTYSAEFVFFDTPPVCAHERVLDGRLIFGPSLYVSAEKVRVCVECKQVLGGTDA